MGASRFARRQFFGGHGADAAGGGTAPSSRGTRGAESGCVRQSAVPVGGEGGAAAQLRGVPARQRDAETGDASTDENKATAIVTA
jgi:hypothetical protein